MPDDVGRPASPEERPLEHPAAHLEQRLLAVLRGGSAPLPIAARLERSEEGPDLEARLRAGDEEAARLADLLAHDAVLEARTRDALLAERQPLLLADGSQLDLATAERRLVEKEERRPFPPLRALVDERAEDAEPPEHTRAYLAERGAVGPGPVTPALDDLRAFLAATRELGEASLEVLAVGDAHPRESPWALARALDLSGPETTLEVARGAISPLKEALAPLHARRAVRTAAPRPLAGVVLAQGGPGDDVRWLVAPTFSARRYLDLVVGGAEALFAALHGPREWEAEQGAGPGPASAADPACRRWGAAATMALLAGPTGDERPERERRDRRLRATWLVRARGQAALALAWAQDGYELEAFEAAIHEQLGALDPGLMREAVRLDWPGSAWPRGPGARLAREARLLGAAASLHLTLRERFDEQWPFEPAVARTLRAAPSLDEGLSDLGVAASHAAGDLLALVGWGSEMM